MAKPIPLPMSDMACLATSLLFVFWKATTGNVKSAKTVLNHPEKYHVDMAIKLGDYNIGHEGKILTLPMYMGFLLTET